MNITYAISLWNFTHYPQPPDLTECVALVREHDFGIELWAGWAWERELRDPAQRGRVRALLDGMTVSFHTAGVADIASHCEQIDLAAGLGAEIVVLHPDDLQDAATGRLDVALARAAVAHASQRGVRLALENGQLPFMAEALDAVPGLGACLDIGHVYLTSDPLPDFLEVMAPRLIHLHLQDTLAPEEAGLPGVGADHYLLGTGGIPAADWALLSETLEQIGYRGIAVFEIRPRSVLQNALLGRRFFRDLLA